MKKLKSPEKLSFNKETVNKLSDEELNNVKGGLPWWAQAGLAVLTGPLGMGVSAVVCTSGSDCDLPTIGDPDPEWCINGGGKA